MAVIGDEELADELRAHGSTVEYVPYTGVESTIAAVQRALRDARTSPDEPIAIAGSGPGAGVAAIVAGRDSRVIAAVLIGVPAELEGTRRPLIEITRTRGRVLLVGGDAARYDPVLSQARVRHASGAREDVVAWLDSAFAPRTSRE